MIINANLPLTIKIAGWWISAVSFIIAGISILILFSLVGMIGRGCDKDAGLCAPGAECRVSCSDFPASIAGILLLFLVGLGLAVLLLSICQKLFNRTKAGWYGSFAVLFFINLLAVYIFILILRDIPPVASFADAVYFVLPLINFIPLFLLLLGRKEFFNSNK